MEKREICRGPEAGRDPSDVETFEGNISLDDPTLFINREISWLRFNQRVLEEALDECHPLLERVKFLAICGSNLDEFFMVRVSGLKRQLKKGVLEVPPDGMTPSEQIDAITRILDSLLPDYYSCWHEKLVPRLEEEGIIVRRCEDLTPEQRSALRHLFETEIFPVLTPLACNATHPFPFISNLSINLAVLLRDPAGRELFARVKVPTGLFSRFIMVPDLNGEKNATYATGRKPVVYVLLEDLVSANIDLLFPGQRVAASYPFRITRDADIEIREDEASDLLTSVEESIEARRSGSPVRIELDESTPESVSTMLATKLGLPSYLIHRLRGPPGIADFMELTQISRPDLKDTPFLPSVPQPFMREKNILSALKSGDFLLYHPYESFMPVLAFLREAANDPAVLAIKITLYRIDSRSPLIDSLIEARQNGKQVAAIVELKARFDEENNIGWARALEHAGVHVVYGLAGLKVHAKVCMVVRREGTRIVRYVHLGTGNYNSVTTRMYADLGLFTTDPGIAADVSDLFNFLTGFSGKENYDKLIVAPVALRREITARIEREIARQKSGGDGMINFKMNGLEDKGIIQSLYRASIEGVKVRLDIRGLCCLRPMMKGISENITVTSVVDRFLEHARIYHFHNGGDDEVFLGSADMRPRNLNRRIEILFPVTDPVIRKQVLKRILPIHLHDNVKSRLMLPDGRYERVTSVEGTERIHAQEWLLAHRGSWQGDE